MPQTCLITNKTRAILVLNLPHGLVPEHAKMGVIGTRVATVTSERVEKGRRFVELERKVVAHKRPVSGSVTLLAKGSEGDTAEVARTALFAPDVKAALARGHIMVDDPKVIADDEAHKAKLAASDPTPTEATAADVEVKNAPAKSARVKE